MLHVVFKQNVLVTVVILVRVTMVVVGTAYLN